MTEQTYYRWKKEYGGLGGSSRTAEGSGTGELLLKRLVADLSLDNSILKEVAAGNF